MKNYFFAVLFALCTYLGAMQPSDVSRQCKVPRALIKKVTGYGKPQSPVGLEQLLLIDREPSENPIAQEPAALAQASMPTAEKFSSALADLAHRDIDEIRELYTGKMGELCDRLCAAIANPRENQHEVRRIMGTVGIDAITYHDAFTRAFLEQNTALLAGLLAEVHREKLHIGWAAYDSLCNEACAAIAENLSKPQESLVALITPEIFSDLFDSPRIKKAAETFGKNNARFMQWYESMCTQIPKENPKQHHEESEDTYDFDAWHIDDQSLTRQNRQTQILPRIQKFIEHNWARCALIGAVAAGLYAIRSQPVQKYPDSWPFAPTFQRLFYKIQTH